jgi:hypothetical protein
LSSRERFLIRTVLLGMLCLLPSVPAFTQSLTLPTLLFSGAAAADLATTYAGLSRDSDRLVETNPVLSVTRHVGSDRSVDLEPLCRETAPEMGRCGPVCRNRVPAVVRAQQPSSPQPGKQQTMTMFGTLNLDGITCVSRGNP